MQVSVLLFLAYPLFVITESRSSLFNIRRNTVFFTSGTTLRSEDSDGLLACARSCEKEVLCRYSNYDEKGQICLLARDITADYLGRHWKEREDFTGLEKINYDVNHLKGTMKELPVLNCKELIQINPESNSGVYWIDPDGGSYSNAFKAYCEQATDGGGWTLVWSYYFTNYSHFTAMSNAITPRPNWPANQNDVRVSTTPPLSETQYDAVEFSLWKKIGSDVLIKSNINNWITCKPETGSLVEWVFGSVTCHLVKEISSKCSKIQPSDFKLRNCGPAFTYIRNYYYFDGCMEANWPTHDPCGKGKPKQLTGVENPHGNIFVR